MSTAEKIRILRSHIESTVTLIRDLGEGVQAYITRIDGEGDDTTCTFMDIMEGVERMLSISEIDDIEVQ
jgi:hypothetical protein